MTTHHLDRLIGIFLCVMCLLCVFLWIPADSETGLVETVRRRLIIGDALAPTLASLLGLVCAAVLIIKPAPQPRMSRNALISVSVYIACFSVALYVMRYFGPALIDSLHSLNLVSSSYRPLRTTFPVNYISFVAAGGIMIFSLSVYIDRRYSWTRLGICFALALFIALLFDVPFEDILLPPNGDV